jgi:Ca2+-binding EF-hand superfamily protein
MGAEDERVIERCLERFPELQHTDVQHMMTLFRNVVGHLGSEFSPELEHSRLEAHALFDRVDVNGDGTVTREELFATLQKIGCCSAEEAEAIFASMDADASDQVSRDEFVQYFSEQSADEGRKGMLWKLVEAEERPLDEMRMPVSMLHSYAMSSHLFTCEPDQLHPENVERILLSMDTIMGQKCLDSQACSALHGCAAMWRSTSSKFSRRSKDPKRESTTKDSLLTFEQVLAVLEATGRRNHGLQKAVFPFDPESPLKQAWDLLILLILAYATFSVPYLLAFGVWAEKYRENEGKAHQIDLTDIGVWELVLDILFCTDVLVTFCTCYTKHGVYVTSIRAISWNYLKTWFLIDFVGSVPFDKIFMTALATFNRPLDQQGRDTLQGLRLVRVIKIVRAVRFLNRLNQLEEKDNVGGVRTGVC